MRLEELDFDFPEELIAQKPAEPRDSCRLMYLSADGGYQHLVFSDLPSLLRAGDVLVFNDSRVFPARVYARKPTGAEIEVLFLRPLNGLMEQGWSSENKNALPGELWEVLARPSHRLRPGGELLLERGETLTLERLLGEGRWVVQGPPGRSMVSALEAQGELPLPPYIRSYPEDPDGYQTVYARVLGSAAAPTAGLHFTPGLLRQLETAGVESVFVTLHVGLDTFLPIRDEVIEDHRIHCEWYCVQEGAVRRLREAKAKGSRLVAIGTTATRVLETLARDGALNEAAPSGPVCGSTDIYITPGYHFQAVNALLTNFHLPRSSVLALTMAFAGVERLRAAYQDAVARRYRLFSFGDAMLIDPVDTKCRDAHELPR